MTRDIYLALGDSITAGQGATHPNFTFVHHVSDAVKARDLAVRTLVVARSGWTAKDLLHATSAIGSDVWNRANVLTLIIGGNDLRRLLRRSMFSLTGTPISRRDVDERLHNFRFHLEPLCERIRDSKIPHTVMSTLYNPLPNYPVAVSAIESLNDTIRGLAHRYKFSVLDLYKPFQRHEAYYIDGYRSGSLPDITSPFRRPIHPNNAGHRRIAELISSHLSREANHKRLQRQAKPRVKQ